MNSYIENTTLNLAFTEDSSIKAIQHPSQHQNHNRPKQHPPQNHKAEELDFSSIVWREEPHYTWRGAQTSTSPAKQKQSKNP